MILNLQHIIDINDLKMYCYIVHYMSLQAVTYIGKQNLISLELDLRSIDE
jgi:hypothetical protein